MPHQRGLFEDHINDLFSFLHVNCSKNFEFVRIKYYGGGIRILEILKREWPKIGLEPLLYNYPIWGYETDDDDDDDLHLDNRPKSSIIWNEFILQHVHFFFFVFG